MKKENKTIIKKIKTELIKDVKLDNTITKKDVGISQLPSTMHYDKSEVFYIK